MDSQDFDHDMNDDAERGDAPERVIVLDTETTGRSHADGDRIVEIGCVEVVGNVITGRTYHAYVNPAGRKVDPGALEVHGLSDDFLATQPKFRSLYREFFAFVGNAPLVIHNAGFDMGFINMERRLLGLPVMPNEVRDTLRTARIRWPGQRNTLDALCSRLEVDNSGRDLHGALIDADLLAQVYIKMMKLDQLPLGGDEETERAAQSVAAPVIAISRPPRPPRPALAPSPGEEAAFHAFIASSVKDSIWSGLLEQRS